MSQNLVLNPLQTSQKMDLCIPIKKNKGRQKIEMKKIENRSNLMVTFSKRKHGVFKKAGELSVLCGPEIAVVLQSPGDKVYTFGSPSVESVLHRLYGFIPTDEDYDVRKSISQSKLDYSDAEMRLFKEKETGMNSNDFWWNRDTGCVDDVEDLEKYLERLKRFRSCFLEKADEIKLQSAYVCVPDLISIEESDGLDNFEELGYLLEGLEQNIISESADATSILKNKFEELNHDIYGYDDTADLENLLECDFGKLLEDLEERFFSDASCSSANSGAS